MGNIWAFKESFFSAHQVSSIKYDDDDDDDDDATAVCRMQSMQTGGTGKLATGNWQRLTKDLA